MNESKREFAAWLVKLFEEAGIDPIYAATIICVLITLLGYRSEFKNWDKAPKWKKGFAKSAIYASVVLLFISFLQLIGAF